MGIQITTQFKGTLFKAYTSLKSLFENQSYEK